ncbi:MAG: NUDIX hydrolase [Pseudochelatococcus sp.]|uniref:NUDIX hydrolase n=1 Tax=Pseudochelatococcus sp. TaxID=2020869 RepID=UPI003D901D9A
MSASGFLLPDAGAGRAASIAVFRGPDVLLVRRRNPPAAGLWSLPGGRIEPGETPEAAALRELAEETAVAVQPVSLRFVGRHDVAAHRFVIAVFAARWQGGEAVAGSDSAAAGWFGADEIAGLPVTDGLAAWLIRARAALDAPAAVDTENGASR